MPEEAWIELAFEQGIEPGRVDDEGHMNFLERGLLKLVQPNQLLATLHPPESTTLEALSLELGAGVALAADGAITARRAGVLHYSAGKLLDVVESHVHRGAVDLRSGHLDMQGSLTVQGDVERLLQARASGDLEVLGSVSGGSLRAGGALRVSGIVRGADAARVVAGGDATLKTCEAAEVSVAGTLRVREAVNSRLSAQRVFVSGRMRGGSAHAETSVSVGEAGTPAGLETQLCAAEPLELPSLEQVQRALIMQKLRRMAERGGVRESVGQRGSARAKGGKLGRVDAALSAEELAERSAQAERRGALQRSAFLEVGLAHPGVELRIGNARLTLEHPARRVRYAWDAETGNLRAERTSK